MRALVASTFGLALERSRNDTYALPLLSSIAGGDLGSSGHVSRGWCVLSAVLRAGNTKCLGT